MRDEIQHSWDYRKNQVTRRASDVLKFGTGYCYAKSHFLAALLRANGIPAVLSDIQSNVFALEAVLAELQGRSADVVVNLGDVLYGPIAPRGTYDILCDHDIVAVMKFRE